MMGARPHFGHWISCGFSDFWIKLISKIPFKKFDLWGS